MEKYPMISVTFSLDGRQMDIEKVSTTLNLLPTSTRTKEDWPEALKKQAAFLPKQEVKVKA